MYLMIVKRGDFQEFDRLHRAFAARPIQVVWDRRTRAQRRVGTGVSQSERPVVDGRHLADRRGSAQASWTALGFVVTRANGA